MKRILATLLAGGLCLFAGLVAAHTFTPVSHKTSERFAGASPGDADEAVAQEPWEYLIVQGGTTNLSPSGSSTMRKEASSPFARENFPLEQNLDKLGAKGWELVAVTGSPGDPIYYLKRRK